MTDAATRAARDDLAFLKAVSVDRGPLPAILGAHMLGVGLSYAPNLVLVWAIFAGRVPWPDSLMWGTWLPGTALWALIWVCLQWRGGYGGYGGFGPSARVFGAAWGAMGLMTAAMTPFLALAEWATGESYFILWPAIGFILWGGAWSVVAIIRRRLWLMLIGLASFVTAIGCAPFIRTPEVWLVMAGGLLLVFALPGVIIMRLAPRPD